jgi:hypothetical protein
MWDIFLAFVLLGAGSILAFYELRRWIATKRWIHLAAILAAIVSEVAIIKGFTEASVMLVCTVVLAFVAEGRKGS